MEWPWSRKKMQQPVREEEPLAPGICECGHLRCAHDDGKSKCRVGHPPNDKWPNGSFCACQIFIRDDEDDDDDDDNETEPITPSPEDLEVLYRK